MGVGGVSGNGGGCFEYNVVSFLFEQRQISWDSRKSSSEGSADDYCSA